MHWLQQNGNGEKFKKDKSVEIFTHNIMLVSNEINLQYTNDERLYLNYIVHPYCMPVSNK